MIQYRVLFIFFWLGLHMVDAQVNPLPGGRVETGWNTTTFRSYDLNGNQKSSGRSYYDFLGKAVQVQSWTAKLDTVWVSNLYYDFQGRPALQTLDAPNGFTDAFFYDGDHVLNSADGRPIEASDFEGDKLFDPPLVSAGNPSLGWYYSSANTDEPYQDVTDRPYSRTLYSKLRPGAVLATIGGNKVENTDVDKDGDMDSYDEWPQVFSFTMKASRELTEANAFDDTAYGNMKIMKTVTRDVHGNENVVFTDTDGKVLATARSGGGGLTSWGSIDFGEQRFIDVHVPKGVSGFVVENTDDDISPDRYTVYDLITEKTTDVAISSIGPGFYRVVLNEGTSAAFKKVSYRVNYYDYSLNEYDEAGRLTASYQPMGATLGEKPKTTYEYNTLGQLTKVTSPDEGISEFIYRKDGQIRFSQNSEQKKELLPTYEEYSFTNYDSYGRPILSGISGHMLPGHPGGTASGIAFNDLDPDLEYEFSSAEQTTHTQYDRIDPTELVAIEGLGATYHDPSFLAGNVSKTWNDQSTTYYSYDIHGRVKWLVQDITGLGVKTIDYEYDAINGQVTKVYYQKGAPDQFIHRYSYDPDDYSLVKVETATNESNYTPHASYEYYKTGGLKRMKILGDNELEVLQGVDYVYNLAGQLKGINHPSLAQGQDPGGDANDLFGMQLDYHSNDYARSLPNITTPVYGQNQYNGNIKGIRWNNANGFFEGEVRYAYTYDRNNWLTGADFYTQAEGSAQTEPTLSSRTPYGAGQTAILEATQSITLLPGFEALAGSNVTIQIVAEGQGSNVVQDTDYDVSGITYDANGNIQRLNRNKGSQNGSNAMDNLTYVYGTDPQDGPNQLLQVKDYQGDVPDADDIGNQGKNNYGYNTIGQLVRNNAEDIDYLYNASGLVTQVNKGGQPVVKFFYNDRNHRVRKEAYVSGNLSYTEHYVRDVAGMPMAIYRDNAVAEYAIYGSGRIGVHRNGADYYQLTDHLGNVRAVFTKNQSNEADLEGYTDYYPFGMPMPGRNIVGDYRYAFQGQEKDPETGKEAFELRLWDSRIGRWLTTDPAGQYHSPYLGMGNNPMNGVDPDGGTFFDRYKLGKDGSVTYYDDKGGDAVDYLFVEGDLSNEIMLTDTSILPQLERNGFWGPIEGGMANGHIAISSDLQQVEQLYNWIGARSPVEWSFADANTDFGRRAMIGTMHQSSSGLTPRPNKNGLGNFTLNRFSHTHYGTSHDDFSISGPDYNYASEMRLLNPNAKFDVYMPLLTRETYNNAFKNRYIPGSNPLTPYPPIHHDPPKFRSY